MRELLELKIARLRYRGYGGTRIRPHRSIFHIQLNPADVLIALLLPMVFNILLLLYLDDVVVLWRSLFEFWLDKLLPGTDVASNRIDIGNYVLWLPIPDLSAHVPGAIAWFGTLIGCVVAFLATCFIPPERFLPLTYMMRACLAIQTTALLYFYFLPGSFPYDLRSYLTDVMGMSMLFMFIAPWILGLTYGVFDFPLIQKVALMALVLAYFTVALPMQYLLHAIFLHSASLLFLPICYLVFGIFIDVMIFVAFYSWGMSWRFTPRRREAD